MKDISRLDTTYLEIRTRFAIYDSILCYYYMRIKLFIMSLRFHARAKIDMIRFCAALILDSVLSVCNSHPPSPVIMNKSPRVELCIRPQLHPATNRRCHAWRTDRHNLRARM